MALPTYVLPGQSYITPESLKPDPGVINLRSQLVGNLSGALKGELPADVKTLLQQEAAQNAVGNGVSGSQFANYQGLRTLGLTSLDRMQGAEKSLVNPLLGYRPSPVAPFNPPLPYYEGTGGFNKTMPRYNVGPIQSGGGAPGRTPNPTLPDYQQGGGGTSTGNVLNDLLSKYGPLGNSGSSPMGGYGGTSLFSAGDGSANASAGPGGGSTYFGNPDEAAALQEQQQNLIGAGFNPVDFGYQNSDLNAAMAEQAQNLQYSDLNPTDFGYG